MLHRLIAASILVALCAAPACAQQSAFPDKTIKVIVPFAAGGGVDVMARLFAEKAGPMLGVPVIVENRAGASGTIGGQAVHQSPPDRYSLLFAPLTHVMGHIVLKSAPYHAVNDFTPGGRHGEPALPGRLAPRGG